ncbi:MAG: hypothetical protein ACJAVI_001550 [Candidatus Azotimanducaceae bacterium]
MKGEIKKEQQASNYVEAERWKVACTMAQEVLFGKKSGLEK